MAHRLRCYDYVHYPYERVRAVVRGDARALFRRATDAASARAEALHARLHAHVGPVEVESDVELRILGVEATRSPLGGEATCVGLAWQALRARGAFPIMRAELSLYPLTDTETQLELEGTYEPPLGPLGKAVDAVVGHRIAEASVHQLLQEVAARLRETLAAAARPA